MYSFQEEKRHPWISVVNVNLAKFVGIVKMRRRVRNMRKRGMSRAMKKRNASMTRPFLALFFHPVRTWDLHQNPKNKKLPIRARWGFGNVTYGYLLCYGS
tara:strand:+ start:1408 stop:1707 length:300 start_codon:yes stop_codon:yes gene_type:complete